MLKRTKLKDILEDTLEILSDLKLNGKLTTISLKEVSILHRNIEKMHTRVKKSSRTDHSTLF